MRRVPVVLLALVVPAAITACGDDQDDLDSGPAADGAESSTAVTDDDAVGDDDDAADDAADDDGADETTTGAAEGSGSSATDGDTDGDDAEVACLPAEVFDALQQHTADLRAASYLLAGEPGEDTMTGFLLAPGLPMPPAVPSMTQGDVMAACEEAIALPVVCDVGSCRLLQCTEDGWITQLWVIPPVASDGWVFTQVRVQSRWIAGETGTTFRIGVTGATPFGTEISLSGRGQMNVDGFVVEEEFPALHEAARVVLTVSEGADGSIGTLRIGEVVAAEVDASGQLQPTGECP